MLVHFNPYRAMHLSRDAGRFVLMLVGACLAGLLVGTIPSLKSWSPPPPPMTAKSLGPKVNLPVVDLQTEQPGMFEAPTDYLGQTATASCRFADTKVTPITIRCQLRWQDRFFPGRASYLLEGRQMPSRFWLQRVDPRTWDLQWLFLQHLRQEELTTASSQLVVLQVNGHPHGVFWLDTLPDETSTRTLQSILDSLADGVPLDRLIDRVATARFLAAIDLWSQTDALQAQYVRFAQTQPGGTWVPLACRLPMRKRIENRVLAIQPSWTRPLLSDLSLCQHYVEQMNRFTQDKTAEAFRQEFSPTLEALYRTLDAPPKDGPPWPQLDEHRQMLQQLLAMDSLAFGQFRTMTRADGRQLQAEIDNAMKLPIEILGFEVETAEAGEAPVVHRFWQPRPRVVYPRDWSEQEAPRQTFFWPLEEPRSVTAVRVVARLLGQTRTCCLPLRRRQLWDGDLSGPPAPLPVDELLTRYPFLDRARPPHTLSVRPGDWTVEGDLVIPAGWTLAIGPDTTLRFPADGVLLARGPLAFNGAPQHPIRLLPRSQSWCGVVVLHADESEWKHVHVQGTTGVARPGWQLTGGVTFYQSGIHFQHCRFADSLGEDAVNVVRGAVRFDACQFERSASDAFDGDFVTADIRDCRFDYVKGDAIDISGSRVEVRDVRLAHIGDKAISSGEASECQAWRIHIDHARIGICSKDQSRVLAVGVTVDHTQFALATYTKKPEYGPATLEVREIRVEQTEQLHLTQHGSTTRIDGKRMPSVDVDIETLYSDSDKPQHDIVAER